MTNTRAALYTRLSLDPNGEGVAVARQREDCLRIAKERGWLVVGEFSDNSKSAWKTGVRRPGWEDMLAMVAGGGVDALIVWHGDRLMRQPRDLERLIDLADKGLTVTSVAGERDLSSADDRFVMRIEVAAQCRESDSTSRRVKRALEARAMKGQRAGRVPYGWRSADEAAVVRRIVSGVIQGRSVRAITIDLNAEGIPSPQGGTWDKVGVRWVAMRRSNAGQRVHKGVVIGEGNWEALVSVEEMDSVERILTAKAEASSGGHNTRRWLLSGLMKCGKCGAGMTHSPHRGGIYRCVTSHLTIRGEAAEEFVLDVVQARLAKPDAVAATSAGADAEVATLRRRITALKETATALAEDFADGLISREAMRAGITKAEATGRDLSERLASLEVEQGAKANLPADIRSAPLDVQRATIDALVSITVLPAAGPARTAKIEDRMEISWR